MARPGDPQKWIGGRVAAPFDIVRAAHCELIVTDLARARHFYADLLGLVITRQVDDAIYLRGYEDRRHHCLVLRAGTRAAVGHLAFLVASEGDLERASSYYSTRGCPTCWIDGGEAGQGRALRAQDPLGFPVEFFASMEPADSYLQRFDLHRGARIMRIDHFNLQVPDVQQAFDVYYDELGFRCSEFIDDGHADRLLAAWLFRKPTVHDVAFTAGAGPRLHHLGFWAADTAAILNACDVLASAGYAAAIERGPGRHGVSNAFYLYMRDPDGHRIELFSNDYWTGDPDLEPLRWSVRDELRRSFWGAEVPERWYRESSEVLALDGVAVPVREPDPAATEIVPR